MVEAVAQEDSQERRELWENQEKLEILGTEETREIKASLASLGGRGEQEQQGLWARTGPLVCPE